MGRDLRGAVVVITGASSGVGRATALAFARHGSRLVVAARSVPALEALAGECRALGAEVVAVPTDIGRVEEVDDLARQARERFGRIDIWVQAAAAVLAGGFVDDDPGEVERLITTNVAGTYWSSRAAMASFERQGSGTLINVGSLLGMLPNPVVPAYVMSKFAVRGLTLSLRMLASGTPGIDVCLVLPGPIDTPLFQRAANHTGKELRAIPPAIAPERVAAAVVACARRPRRQISPGVTGRVLLVGHRVLPRAVERLVAEFSMRAITRPDEAPASSGTIFAPVPDGEVEGGWRRGRLRRALGNGWGRVLAGRGGAGRRRAGAA